TDEPVILNKRTGRRRGTAEFLGRDEEPTTTPCSGLAAVETPFAAPWQTPKMCLVQPAFACFETTPVLATTNHETCRRSDERKPRPRSDKPGRMKNQNSSPRTGSALLTNLAI